MSYMTYLRNKANSQPKVIDLHKPTDASQHTQKMRFEANRVFFADGSMPPVAASENTSYRGYIATNTDAKYLAAGRITQQTCCQIETPDSSKYKGAGDITKELQCSNLKLAESPKFVDTTISLSAMHPKMVTAGCCEGNGNRELVTPNHTHSPGLCPPEIPTGPVGKRSEIMKAPSNFQNQGIGGKRAGGYYKPGAKYVENKHGNDLNVNPRRVPTEWVNSKNAPTHLKINDPTFANVKP